MIAGYIALFEAAAVPANINELDRQVNFLINNSREAEAKQLVEAFKLKNPKADTSSILVVKNSPWRYAFYHAPAAQKKEKLVGWLSDYMQKGMRDSAQAVLAHISKSSPQLTSGIDLNSLSKPSVQVDVRPAPGVKVVNAAINSSTRSVPSLVNFIIDNIEKGYVNPKTVPPAERAAFANSGETLFGLDRKNGSDYAKHADAAWKQFWSLIDADKAKNPRAWVRNYMGGPLEPTLRSLTHKIIEPNLQNYLSAYLSPKAKYVVESDGRLLVMFVECMFNGLGFFQSMASEANAMVNSGKTNTTYITSRLLASKRTKTGLISSRTPALSALVGIS